MGIFKALFAVFGAVHAAVPGIAAPIITAGVTAGTITQAEATQLTALLAAQQPLGAGAGSSGGSGSGTGTPFTKPSAGEITVLHQVITAVLGQLPTIAAPVLAAEVANGDITQAESDMFTKLITGFASISSSAKTPGSTATGSSTLAGLTGSTAGGNLLSTLASEFAGKLDKKPAAKPKAKKSTKKTTKHHTVRKASTTTRTHHSG
jgi:hypothetical protein